MSRHRNMKYVTDEYYEDEDYYDDYDDGYGYDDYPASTPKINNLSVSANKKNNNTPKAAQNTPKKSDNSKNNNKSQNSKNSNKGKGNQNGSKGQAQNSQKSSQSQASTLNSIQKQNSKPEPKLKNIVDLHRQSSRKPVLNLVIIGHIDAGKSTLTGHLLLKKGLVNQQEFHKVTKEADNLNKSSFKFAYLLDDDELEREKGVTINTSKKSFETDKYLVTLADAPGHRDFVPNMISGAANADAAILVVDARKGEFESGFSNNGQTKEHALIIKSLGVTKLIIAINKMDSTLPKPWDKQRFDEIQALLSKFLTKNVNFKRENLKFIAVSGLNGDNLIERKWPNLPSLMNLIDGINLPVKDIDKPVRVSLTDLFSVNESKISCIARVEQGNVQIGQHLLLQPYQEQDRQVVQISNIYRSDVEEMLSADAGEDFDAAPITEYAVVGESISLDLTPVNFSKFENTYTNNLFLSCPKDPFTVGKKFQANLLILGGDAQTYDNVAIPPITRGFNITCHINLIEVPGKILKLVGLIDRTTGEMYKNEAGHNKKVRVLNKGDAAVIDVALDKFICCDLKNNLNSRFTVRIQGITIGSGIFKKVY